MAGSVSGGGGKGGLAREAAYPLVFYINGTGSRTFKPSHTQLIHISFMIFNYRIRSFCELNQTTSRNGFY